MQKPYIYESSKNKDLFGEEGIIMLPDIYCQTEYSKKTVEDFANSFKKPVFMLDYFFLGTNEANNFSSEEKEKAHSLMQNFDPNAFVLFFKNILGEIKESYPQIKKFIVIGFCFGGRLAYIAGGEKGVSKIFSFYGAGPFTPNYINNETPVDYLISKRANSDLSVHSFFGTKDSSIPESDRQQIKEKLSLADIYYEGHEYDAGHAYFQEGRSNYDEQASKDSWEILRQDIK